MAGDQIWPGKLLGPEPTNASNARLARFHRPIFGAIDAPDTEIDFFSLQNEVGLCGQAVFTSVRGVSHRIHGLPRQDSGLITRATVGGHEAVVLVVADGVSSAENSHIGSKLASKSAVDYLQTIEEMNDSEWERISGELARFVSSQLDARASSTNILPSSLSTTLKVAVVTDTGLGQVVYCMTVGDGLMLRVLNGKPFHLLKVEPEGRDALVLTTNSLPAAQPSVFVNISSTRYEEVIAIMTDGVEEIWQYGEGLGNFLDQEEIDALELAWRVDIDEEAVGDDRTIAIWRSHRLSVDQVALENSVELINSVNATEESDCNSQEFGKLDSPEE